MTTHPCIPDLNITVGPDAARADIVGQDHKALQAGVDYLAQCGGGTLNLQPGRYVMRAAICLRNNIRIQGAGGDTVLIKGEYRKSDLAHHADWYQNFFEPADPSVFEVGDGVHFFAPQANGPRPAHQVRRIVGRDGDRFMLDRILTDNFWIDKGAYVEGLHSLIHGFQVHDIEINDVLIDGAREHNAFLDGNYIGGIFLQECERARIQRVAVHHFNGDAISWQVVPHTSVSNCEIRNCAGLGLHPGSGSVHAVMTNNVIEDTRIGIFYCWGVRHGIAENNRIVRASDHGVSIGHQDTDAIVRSNHLLDCGKVGVYFRPESSADRCGHRGRVEGNTIENTGPPETPDNADNKAAAIELAHAVQDVVIKDNKLIDTRSPASHVGIRIGPDVGQVSMQHNSIQGMATEIVDQR